MKKWVLVTDAVVFSPSGSKSLDESSREASLNSRIACSEDIDGNEFIVSYRYTLTPQMKGKEIESLSGAFLRVTRPLADYQKIQPIPSHCARIRNPDGSESVDCNHDGACHMGNNGQPNYPRDDLISGNAGKVVLLAKVDPSTGKATSVEPVQSTKFKGLNAAAMNAAKATTLRCLGINPNVLTKLEYEFTVDR